MTESEIQDIEFRIGVQLPDAYRTFLLILGQSSFNRNVVFDPIRAFPDHVSETGKGQIDVFYGGCREASDAYSLA